MFDLLKSLLPPSVPKYGKKEQDELSRRAAGMVSSGNVHVQFGHFLTRSDIEALRREVLNPSR